MDVTYLTAGWQAHVTMSKSRQITLPYLTVPFTFTAIHKLVVNIPVVIEMFHFVCVRATNCLACVRQNMIAKVEI